MSNKVVNEAAFLSVQVLNEYASVARRKLKRSWSEIAEDIHNLTDMVPLVVPLTSATNSEALRIVEHYQLAFYDALMVAAALLRGCTIFYSEDMQHGMVIDKKLTIINPFLEPDAI